MRYEMTFMQYYFAYENISTQGQHKQNDVAFYYERNALPTMYLTLWSS